MTRATIKAAADEARRFLTAVKAVHTADFLRDWEGTIGAEKQGRNSPQVSPKLTGALRRASMDLTRALAEMRKP